MFEYECPICGNELRGGFGDDVTCEDCKATFETEWERVDYDNATSWIVKQKS